MSRIKSSVADWLNGRKFDPATPPLERNTRDGRGIQHDVTGRLLCTISLDWNDLMYAVSFGTYSIANCLKSTRAKIKNFEDEDHYYGKDYYARCFYLGESGDPKNVRAGFLKSALLVKVILVQRFEFLVDLRSTDFQIYLHFPLLRSRRCG